MTNFTDHESSSSNHPDLWTVRRIISWSIDYLNSKAKDFAATSRLDVELLLASVLKIDRMRLFLELDRPLTKDERESFKLLLRRRADFEPVAYILGYRDFYRHRFVVDRHVLIPRPDTELLVELALGALKDYPTAKILDIGTGSGCIAISLASELPEADVWAWDVSEEALRLARTNAAAAGVKNVNFLKQDALSLPLIDGMAFDVIVSNPPYISRSNTTMMGMGVEAYEPSLALFAGDAEGLQFYVAFANHYGAVLNPGGKIFLEIGFDQGAKVAQLFDAAGWRKIKVSKDLSGHDRIVSAEKP